jgi:hypothetical protein
VALFRSEAESRLGGSSGRSGGPSAPRSEPEKDPFTDDDGKRRPFAKGDSMSEIQTDLMRQVPSIVPHDIPAMSDEECLIRLAQAVQDHDSECLEEVARLIGRLAVTIE